MPKNPCKNWVRDLKLCRVSRTWPRKVPQYQPMNTVSPRARILCHRSFTRFCKNRQYRSPKKLATLGTNKCLSTPNNKEVRCTVRYCASAASHCLARQSTLSRLSEKWAPNLKSGYYKADKIHLCNFQSKFYKTISKKEKFYVTLRNPNMHLLQTF